MQISLHRDSIVRKEQRMDIKTKGNRGITKLSNTIHRIKTTSHADLDHPITERSDIRDNIHISCTNISGTEVNFFDLLIKTLKLRPDLIRLIRSPLLHKRLKHVMIVLTFLIQLCTTLSKFLLSLAFFTKPCLLLTLRILLRFFRILIPER